MSLMRRRYSVPLYGHYKNQMHCRASLGKLTVLFVSEPEHEINMRGAPYELVPG